MSTCVWLDWNTKPHKIAARWRSSAAARGPSTIVQHKRVTNKHAAQLPRKEVKSLRWTRAQSRRRRNASALQTVQRRLHSQTRSARTSRQSWCVCWPTHAFAQLTKLTALCIPELPCAQSLPVVFVAIATVLTRTSCLTGKRVLQSRYVVACGGCLWHSKWLQAPRKGRRRASRRALLQL